MRFPKFTYGQNQIVKDNTTVAPINIITPDMQKAKLELSTYSGLDSCDLPKEFWH